MFILYLLCHQHLSLPTHLARKASTREKRSCKPITMARQVQGLRQRGFRRARQRDLHCRHAGVEPAMANRRFTRKLSRVRRPRRTVTRQQRRYTRKSSAARVKG